MSNAFIEVKSTENQTVFLRPEAISAFEVVTASNRAEGHIKVFVGGFKFLVAIEKDELLIKLNSAGK